MSVMMMRLIMMIMTMTIDNDANNEFDNDVNNDGDDAMQTFENHKSHCCWWRI